MTAGECKERMTATEFLRWVAYIEREPNEFHREDFFFARMSYQLYLIPFMFGGKPKLTEEQFLIRFEQVKQGKIKEIETEEERKERMMEAQKTIVGFFGIKLDKDGKPVEQDRIKTRRAPKQKDKVIRHIHPERKSAGKLKRPSPELKAELEERRPPREYKED